MKKRLIPILSTAVVATALAITAVSTMSAVKRPVQADFNYSISFTKDTGASVQLQDKGGTYVASVDGGTLGGDYFCTLPHAAALSFDFDAASKAAGVEKFLSIIGVRVVADRSGYGVYGSTYQNAFDNAGEYFDGEEAEDVYTFPYSVNYIGIQNWQSMDVHITSVTIYYECGIASKPDNVTALAAPANIEYDATTEQLSWDVDPDAMLYILNIGGVENNTPILPGSSARISTAIRASNIPFTVELKAKHNNIVSPTAEYDVGYYKDVDKILEAETACLDRQRNWSNDGQAHGGAYGLAFNARGQGMYYRYYAYEAGQRDVTVTYATGMAGSKMRLYANGQSYWVVFSEYTNWFGDAHVTANVKVEDVTFVQGWNELYLFKDGEESDNPAWGGYAQVDYITVEGTGNKYDMSLFNLNSNSYSLEGEMGHWHHANESILPEKWGGNFSLGFGLGSMDGTDDGVKFDIDIAEAGTYAFRPVMGGNKGLRVSVDGGEYTSYSFGAYSEWNDPVMAANDICVVELTAGFHYIDFMRDGNWFTFDRVVIERVA